MKDKAKYHPRPRWARAPIEENTGGDSAREKSDTIISLLDEWGDSGEEMVKVEGECGCCNCEAYAALSDSGRRNLTELRDVATAIAEQLMEAELSDLKNELATIPTNGEHT